MQPPWSPSCSPRPPCGAIATSRERLGVGWAGVSVGAAFACGGVELFTARARRVNPDYEPGAEIDSICDRLD